MITAQSIEVYDTVAIRDANMPLPKRGAACWIIDTGAFLIYYGTALGWRPPWNTPWGRVARTVDVLDESVPSPTVETEVVGARTTLTAVVNRLYRISVELVAWQGDATANRYLTLRLKDGNTLLGLSHAAILSSAAVESAISFSVETALPYTSATPSFGASVHVIRLTMAPEVVGMNPTIDTVAYPLTLTVDDIGPFADPLV